MLIYTPYISVSCYHLNWYIKGTTRQDCHLIKAKSLVESKDQQSNQAIPNRSLVNKATTVRNREQGNEWGTIAPKY